MRLHACECGCPCTADGYEHFDGSSTCACQKVGCACVSDQPFRPDYSKFIHPKAS